jgi:hypothetical protein
VDGCSRRERKKDWYAGRPPAGSGEGERTERTAKWLRVISVDARGRIYEFGFVIWTELK